MQSHNDQEGIYNERVEYMGSAYDYEPLSGEPLQQHSYSSPSGYGPAFYTRQSFADASPRSDSRFAAILSYSFGWLTGLLFTLFGGQDRFIRFHALQSLLFFGMINLVDCGLITTMIYIKHQMFMVHVISLPLFACVIAFLLVNFIAFVCWIVAMVQAARGVYFRLPFVGEWVAQHFNLHATPL